MKFITMIVHNLISFFNILGHPLNRKGKIKTAGRIFWWKINQLFFHFPAVVTLNGTHMKCICPTESSYGGMVMYCNLPEYPEMKFLRKILKSGATFIDVGANIGVYTLLAASKIKKGKIYSFEPIQNVLSTLYQNIKLNDLEDKVTIVEKVVSDKTGKESFVMQDISEYSYISPDKSVKSASFSCVRMDDFCKSKKIDFIDVIKIDVEGAEMKVLKGLEKYLNMGKVGNLIIELNKRNSFYGADSNQILDFLKKLKFKIFVLDEEISLKKIEKVDVDQTLNVIAILNA